MESKIVIDIDGDGQPRIKIDYKLTDDLRDRLVGRFLYKMGIPAERPGFWAYCRLGHESNEGAVVTIEPLNDLVLAMHLPEIHRYAEKAVVSVTQ